ncbi:head-tail connector protein [Falsochrobactrum sp. TDYN1]|uniref:Head-tail connector protein n=1 Tax=Falsochrobactrum tianjinense TaxID=2706015 RepID=A0A949PT50_9HYPH|nr:head-tail connector protein [Falsochrobactrum sp. TDYN1]MBV2144410.1 head-tail connector protein [Falsochrobactrum sp. TDYN1]
MAEIVTLQELKDQLNFTADQGVNDDALLSRKLKAAQNYIESLLGFKLEETYGGADQEEAPAALVEAIYQTAAHWYENREAVLVGVSAQDLPFGVWPIVNEFRRWSF